MTERNPVDALDRAVNRTAHQREIRDLRRVLTTLLMHIEDTQDHGGGAHDNSCPICVAMADARKVLER